MFKSVVTTEFGPSTSSLQEVGTVLHQARSGRLIIRAVKDIKDNTTLVDGERRRICRVIEMIGPVRAPYFSAMPLTDRIERILGEKLYVSEEPTAQGGTRTPSPSFRARHRKDHRFGRRRARKSKGDRKGSEPGHRNTRINERE